MVGPLDGFWKLWAEGNLSLNHLCKECWMPLTLNTGKTPSYSNTKWFNSSYSTTWFHYSKITRLWYPDWMGLIQLSYMATCDKKTILALKTVSFLLMFKLHKNIIYEKIWLQKCQIKILLVFFFKKIHYIVK